MRFHSRAFLFSFVPFACLLALSFVMVQRYVQNTVRDGLRNSLRRSQENVEQLRDLNRIQNARSLESATADQELLAAMSTAAGSAAASGSGVVPADAVAAAKPDAVSIEGDPGLQATLQDELLKFGVHAGHDLVIATGPNGQPLSGAVRAGGDSSELVPMYVYPDMEWGGLLVFRGEPYQTDTMPMVADGRRIGSLTVGKQLNVSLLSTSSVLMHGSRALYSTLDKTSLLDTGMELNRCATDGECDVKLKDDHWMALPILKDAAHSGWRLYSLVNVDQATAPVSAAIRRIFLSVALISLITTLLCSFLSSRAIVRPIAAMVAHLHHSANTGVLPEFGGKLPTVFEVKELARSYNLAANSVRNAQDNLQGAYIEFVYSLANALDARDKYTAGHSKRVSDLCCAIAAEMKQSKADIDRLRIGALLHDIGKIGVSDLLLQKPGRLSDEEFATIKRHPVMGRRILQGVQGFAKYLPAVELHHENWDGTGYPKRQRGEETPLDARIIHVADAYDAMTTDRAYRNSMTHDRAIDILTEHAGTQFDPDVVAALIAVTGGSQREAAPTGSASPTNRRVSITVPAVEETVLVHQHEGALVGQRMQLNELEDVKLPVC